MVTGMGGEEGLRGGGRPRVHCSSIKIFLMFLVNISVTELFLIYINKNCIIYMNVE